MTVEKGKPIEHKEDKRTKIENAVADTTKNIKETNKAEAQKTTEYLTKKVAKEKATKIKQETFTSNEVQEAFSPIEGKDINQESCKTNAHTFIDGLNKKHNRAPEHINQAKAIQLPVIKPLGTETPADMANVINYFNAIAPEPNPTLTQYIDELKQGTITPQNQKAYNNLLHIFATGKGLSTTEIHNQKTTREKEQKMTTLQENFEKAKNPDNKMKVLTNIVDETGEYVGGGGIKEAFDALLSGNFKEATKHLGTFLKYVMAIITGKKLDTNEKLFNIKTLDFTGTSIINLIGSNETKKDETTKKDILDNKGDRTFVSLSTAEKEKEWGKIKGYFTEKGELKEEEILKNKHSLYTQIKEKKKSCGIKKDIMYTRALSKLKDTLYLKRKQAKENDRKRDTETENNSDRETMKKQLSSKEGQKADQTKRIKRNAKPGDIVFFVGGDKRNEKGEIQKSSIISKGLELFGGAGNHVGIIGENNTLIHSTQKGKGGVMQVDLTTELDSRPNAGIIIARPHQKITKEDLQTENTENKKTTIADKAQQYLGKKYDHMEAITSLRQKTGNEKATDQKPNQYNCASLVTQSMQDAGIDMPHTGIPAEIMESDKLTLEYATQRHG